MSGFGRNLLSGSPFLFWALAMAAYAEREGLAVPRGVRRRLARYTTAA